MNSLITVSNNVLLKTLTSIKQHFLLTLSLLIGFTLIWLSTALTLAPTATALTLEKQPLVVALGSETVENLEEKAKATVDTMAGAGTSDQAEGQVKEAVGTAQRNLGKITGQIEGTAQQVQGKAKQTQGEAKSTIDEAGSEIEEKSENALDALKGFFGQ